MSAVVMAEPEDQARPWRRCASRCVATAVLVAGVAVVGAMATGWPWGQAGAVAVAGVGSWSLADATHGLGRCLANGPLTLAPVAHAAPGLGLCLCVAAAAVASALGGPTLVVLGVVDVVMANVALAVRAAAGAS